MGIPAPTLSYGDGLLGKLAKKLLSDGTDLDRGPGYVDMGIVRAFPSLNLRASLGVEIFFDKTYRLKSIWFEHPFPERVWGIYVGDSPQAVIVKRGEPHTKELGDGDIPRCYIYDMENGQAVKVEFQNNAVSVIAYGTRPEI